METHSTNPDPRRSRRGAVVGVLSALAAFAAVMLGARILTTADQTPDLGPAVRVGWSTDAPAVGSPGPTSRPTTAPGAKDDEPDSDRADEVTPGPLPTAGDDRDENDHDDGETDDDGLVGHDGD